MKITVLNARQMSEVFSMKDAIQADKDALQLYSEGKSNIPLRANLDIQKYNGQTLYMYGYAEPAKASGVKIVSVYPDNIEKGLTSVPATMILVNCETGEVNCMMDGTHLTRIRTGAVAGAATDILARKDSKVFALFGTGGQAESQLEAVLNVRHIELVKVFDINKERAQTFAEKMTQKFGAKFSVKIVSASSASDAVQDADVITTVTTASEPVFDGSLVKKGVHINAVGSYTPSMSEIDEKIIVGASKVYVDTNDAVKESGDLIKPIQKGIFSADKITGELGSVLSRKIPGRTSEDEMTFFETTGSAVLDLVTAQRIYEKALQAKIGSVIEI